MPAYGKYMPVSFCKQLIFPDIPAYYLCILSKPEYKISKLLATLKIAFHITDGLNILKIFSRNLYLKLFLPVLSRVQSTFPTHPEANLHLTRSRALTETTSSMVIRLSLTQQTTSDTDTSVLMQTQSMLVESQDLTLPRT